VKVKAADGEARVVEVLPKPRADVKGHEGPFGDGSLVMPRELIEASGPFAAIALGAKRSVVDVKNMFRMIGRFFSGEINPGKTLGGPGTIVNISSRSANLGIAAFLAFLAFISVNLAVLNILPIPVLDGGSLLLQIVVLFRRGKPLKEATVAYVQWAGFALLMLLMVFAVKNDFYNLSK
jgi:regulator of sigma E protease